MKAPRAVKRQLADRSSLAGVLDGLVGTSICGWCSDGSGAPVIVRLMFGRHVLLETRAQMPRPDVEHARGIPSNCGFAFPLDKVERALAKASAKDSAKPSRLKVVGPRGDAVAGFEGPVDPLIFSDVAAVAYAALLFNVDFEENGERDEIR